MKKFDRDSETTTCCTVYRDEVTVQKRARMSGTRVTRNNRSQQNVLLLEIFLLMNRNISTCTYESTATTPSERKGGGVRRRQNVVRAQRRLLQLIRRENQTTLLEVAKKLNKIKTKQRKKNKQPCEVRFIEKQADNWMLQASSAQHDFSPDALL